MNKLKLILLIIYSLLVLTACNNQNTLIAKYQRTSMGDYFHLIFQDENGKDWDFGNGNNNLGDYNSLNDPNADNSKYVNKKFEINWDNINAEYFCCEGALNLVEGEVPTIIKLKLIDN